MEYKIYDNGVSIWRVAEGYVGIDLDDGEQIRIKDKYLPQFFKSVEAIQLVEAKEPVE